MEHILREKTSDFSLSDSSSRASLPLSISTASTSSSRPTSHHRRRSSVSTRRESAEMMGVALASLSLTEAGAADDADTDNVRRCTLLALEGRASDSPFSASHSIGDFTRVEIPELDSLDSLTDRKADSGRPLFTMSGGVASIKRDSFGRTLTPSSTSKDQQLHTLVEVDEDEEGEHSSPPVKATTKPVQPTLVSSVGDIHSLPKLAPIPVTKPGLKRLTLSACPPLPSVQGAPRTPVSALADGARRRSSLSYRRSSDTSGSGGQTLSIAANALPTPELTPISAEPTPLSPHEQTFLQNNHMSLLARIAELERVLLVRNRSMSTATASSRQLSVSSVSSDAGSNEMLSLVRDLKAERDDLVRDVHVWESRVDDLENQVSLLTRRVENERREVWQTKEKISALEVDKRRLQEDLKASQTECNSLKAALQSARSAENDQLRRFRAEESKRMAAEQELARLQKSNAFTPQRHVPLVDQTFKFKEARSTFPSNVQARHSLSSDVVNSDGENPLTHYEDEDDAEDDTFLYSDDSFSDQIGYAIPTRANLVTPEILLNDGFLKSSSPATKDQFSSASAAVFSTPPPTPDVYTDHDRKSSLEQGWSFPSGAQPRVKAPQEVDRFFQCLDDVEQISESSPFEVPAFQQNAKDKYGFFGDDNDDDDEEDLSPFVIATPSAFHPTDYIAEPDKIAPTNLKPVFEPERRGTVGVSGPLISKSDKNRPATAVSPASPETARRSSPSAIPKLSSASSTPSRLNAALATPTSIPRMRTETSLKPINVIQPSGRPSNRSAARDDGANVHDYSPLINIKRPKINKQVPSAMGSFTSYLPWSGWASSDRQTTEDVSIAAFKGSGKAKTPTNEDKRKTNPKLVPRTTKDSLARQGKAGGLSLL